MPKVKPGESQSDYMSRCVPMVKDEGATQEQAVGKCLGMYRHYSGSESILEKIDSMLEAVVVGTVGKSIEQKICPRNQVWCPKCNACIDRQERTGMGVPAPQLPGPDVKKDKVEFAWEATDAPAKVDLSNIDIFFLEADHDAKWKRLNVKTLNDLLKKTHSKMHPRLILSLKNQVDKKFAKRFWFYVDPYADYINTSREMFWAKDKREADNEVQKSWDDIAEKEPWGEKSFGRLKTL